MSLADLDQVAKDWVRVWIFAPMIFYYDKTLFASLLNLSVKMTSKAIFSIEGKSKVVHFGGLFDQLS